MNTFEQLEDDFKSVDSPSFATIFNGCPHL